MTGIDARMGRDRPLIAKPYEVRVNCENIVRSYWYRTGVKAEIAFSQWTASSRPVSRVTLISPFGHVLKDWRPR